MPDFAEADVVAWFSPLRAPTRQNSWPPAIRPIERHPTVAPLLDIFGAVLSELETSHPSVLPEALMDDAVLVELQTVIAQLGAARLLRLVDWFAVTPPGAPDVLAHLTKGRSSNAQALRSSLRALTVRDTISRMFSPDRVATLQSSAEGAINPQEIP
jgi:hypothetical protein